MADKIKKIRLDVYLVEHLIFESREKARIAIMEGKVFVNNQKEDKPGTMIKDDSIVEYRGEKLKYVSRGGLKLEKAINVFKIDLKDKICMDIGSSTGGFTDCMLQNGAKKVFAVDCGTNQLDYRLRTDNRVVVMENTNARYITKEDINDIVNFASVDVSFISLTKIIPVIKELNISEAVLLIKPQFEAGRELIEKNGVVHDAKVHKQVIESIIDFCKEMNYNIINLDYSPIKGPAGNIEYILQINNDSSDGHNEKNNKANNDLIDEVVDKSHEELV